MNNLPNTLEILILGNFFDSKLDYLPSSLKILGFGEKFNCSLNNLPNSIEQLIIGSKLVNKIEIFPPKLKKITFNNDYDYDLTNLDLNVELNLSYNCSNIKIPNGLKKLQLNDIFFMSTKK